MFLLLFLAALLLFLLPLLLLFLLVHLLLDTREHGPGERQVVVGILVIRVLAQHRLVGFCSPYEIAELEAGVAQVVTGVLLDRGAFHAAEGVGRLLETSGLVQGHAAPVLVTESFGSLLVVAGLEVLVGLLLLVQEDVGPGPSGKDQGQDRGSCWQNPLHFLILRRVRPRKLGTRKAARARTGR